MSLQLSLGGILTNILNSPDGRRAWTTIFQLLQTPGTTPTPGTTAAQAAAAQARRSNGVPLAVPGLSPKQGSGN